MEIETHIKIFKIIGEINESNKDGISYSNHSLYRYSVILSQSNNKMNNHCKNNFANLKMCVSVSFLVST